MSSIAEEPTRLEGLSRRLCLLGEAGFTGQLILHFHEGAPVKCEARTYGTPDQVLDAVLQVARRRAAGVNRT